MANQKMPADWQKVKKRIRCLWKGTSFSDQELENDRKYLSKLVTIIHDKTGENRPLIQRKIWAAIGTPFNAVPSSGRKKARRDRTGEERSTSRLPISKNTIRK